MLEAVRKMLRKQEVWKKIARERRRKGNSKERQSQGPTCSIELLYIQKNIAETGYNLQIIKVLD